MCEYLVINECEACRKAKKYHCRVNGKRIITPTTCKQDYENCMIYCEEKGLELVE